MAGLSRRWSCKGRLQPLSAAPPPPLTIAASAPPQPGSPAAPTQHPAAPAPAGGRGTAWPTGRPPRPPPREAAGCAAGSAGAPAAAPRCTCWAVRRAPGPGVQQGERRLAQPRWAAANTSSMRLGRPPPLHPLHTRTHPRSKQKLEQGAHRRHLVAGDHHYGVGVGDPHVAQVLVLPQALRVQPPHLPQPAHARALHETVGRHTLRQRRRGGQRSGSWREARQASAQHLGLICTVTGLPAASRWRACWAAPAASPPPPRPGSLARPWPAQRAQGPGSARGGQACVEARSGGSSFKRRCAVSLHLLLRRPQPRPSRAVGLLARGAVTLLSSIVPRAGVTNFRATTCSSTGGMAAPVPCALTCRAAGAGADRISTALRHGRLGWQRKTEFLECKDACHQAHQPCHKPTRPTVRIPCPAAAGRVPPA